MVQKQAVVINFSQGLDLKTDPFQLPIGRFLALENSIFTVGGRLTKRNGYGLFTALPESATFLTTFNGNLTAIGSDIQAYSSSTDTWVNKGSLQPVELSVLPLIRSNTNQSQVDAAIAANGLVCTAYIDQTPSSPSTPRCLFAIADSVTGQNIVQPTVLVGANGSPRVFILGNYFVVAYTTSSNDIKYITISTANPTVITASATIAASVTQSSGVSWDAVTVGNNLYFAYNTISGGQAIKITYLSRFHAAVGGAPITAITFTGRKATVMSMTADNSNPANPIVWASFYDSVSATGYAIAVDTSLGTILAPTEIITSGAILNITSIAQNGVLGFYYEVSNSYSYDSGVPTNFIRYNSITQSGSVGSSVVTARSVGLASKAFLLNGESYFLSAYQSPFQPTYFLMSSSGQVLSRFAYSNGGGYAHAGLPSVNVYGNVASIGYLIKDFLESHNVTASESATKGGIYSQTGINLVNLTIGSSHIVPVEIGQSLSLTGGFSWQYDGYVATENNFFVWPDSVEGTWSDSGGSMIANPPGWVSGQPSYQYQVVYTSTNNQGNIEYSAPSIPISITLSTDASTAGSVTLNVPTVRLTYKTANPIKISIYRWSIANQLFYEVTSVQNPLINDATVDSVQFIDTLADSSIIGNSLIYTTGGVVEDIGAPAFTSQALFDDRVWGIDAEDPNLLWYSKQVIESTPVEFSDLFTFYVAPSTASQGSTGNMYCLAPMDDKLIIFKKDAMYYINGSGPDNTGAGSTYSQPIFITATVGSVNQQSIVFTDQGLMFQSDKGIWLLERNGISVVFIGAPVEKLTQNATVNSAVSVPGTTQVRFAMSSGIMLMYDYFFQQWGIFSGIPAISTTLYQGLHSYLDKYGRIFQETPGLYLDGNYPVLISFDSSWFNLAGILGYERIWEIQFLATYASPHKLFYSIAFDHQSISQISEVIPDNASNIYGSDSLYGQTSPFGGPGATVPYRIQMETQKCDSFKITLQEVYDPSLGIPAGAGFTLSSMSLVIGIKRSYRPFAASKTVG